MTFSEVTPILVVVITQIGMVIMMLRSERTKASSDRVASIERLETRNHAEMKELARQVVDLQAKVEKCEREKISLESRLILLEEVRHLATYTRKDDPP